MYSTDNCRISYMIVCTCSCIHCCWIIRRKCRPNAVDLWPNELRTRTQSPSATLRVCLAGDGDTRHKMQTPGFHCIQLLCAFFLLILPSSKCLLPMNHKSNGNFYHNQITLWILDPVIKQFSGFRSRFLEIIDFDVSLSLQTILCDDPERQFH